MTTMPSAPPRALSLLSQPDLPRYVESPGDTAWPLPYFCEQSRLRCYWLPADRDRLVAFCDQRFTRPTGGDVRVRPVGGGVALVFSATGQLRGGPGAGFAGQENEAGFWIPVEVQGPGDSAPRLGWVLPELFVDDPAALVTGREVLGFAKTLAQVQVPWLEAGATGHVDALAPAARVATSGPAVPRRLVMQRLIRVLLEPGTEPAVRPAWVGAATVLHHLTGGRPATMGRHVHNLLGRREVPLLLLRQLRALDDPTRALHQEVIWAPARIGRLGEITFPAGHHRIELAGPDQLPVAAALGLPGSARADGVIDVDLDFSIEDAEVLWRARPRLSGRPPRARTTPRTRVAVLGGGVGALACVQRLLATPGAEDRYEITVYQRGHRLGGKCASGRDSGPGQRIHEHGLHVFFGCYERAFSLVRDVYAEHSGPGATGWEAAFERQRVFELWDRCGDEWRPWRLEFPDNGLLPGDGGPLADGPALVRALGRWLVTAVKMALLPPDQASGAAGRAGTLGLNLARTAALAVVRLCRRAVLSERSGSHQRDKLATLRRHLERLGRRWLLRDEGSRRLWIAIDLGLAVLEGVARDHVLERGFDGIDGEDLRGWLARHGASATSLESAAVRVLYDMTFAYVGGDRSRPALAAGAGLEAILRMLFAYSGSFAWKMRGGMGDVVFTPLYDVLRKKGVRFEFFSDVTGLQVSGGGTTLDGIEILRQATPRSGTYHPLVEVDGRRCWPDRPLHEQLVEGEALARSGIDLEVDPLGWPGAGTRTLRRGVDFDQVVLGIPVGALHQLARPLAEVRPEWQHMLDGLGTVATLSAQLWFDRHPEGASEPGHAPRILGGFTGPFDTWADMSHTLEAETWPAGEAPRAVAYGCGPISDQEADRLEIRPARHALLEGYLTEHQPQLWPALGTDAAGGAPRRYVRVNRVGSERYVQSLPGSRARRLRPDGSGFANLWLVGDWTRNGFDIGCVEAAVRSAEVAARALDGSVRNALADEGHSSVRSAPPGETRGEMLVPALGVHVARH
jgi:uncharacterized protein with NAD-binding domain and iron-sulfur cluster